MTVLLVEQNAQRALDIADYAYILETGRVVLDGTAQKLASNEDVQEFYLGVSNSGRKSLRDVKHYKRRKTVAVVTALLSCRKPQQAFWRPAGGRRCQP